MLCRHPFVRDKDGAVFSSKNPSDWLKGVPFGCGKCLACRVKKRREWTTRLLLEMLKHDSGCFLTLTFSEDYVPVTDGGQRTLDKAELQLFLKRFRRNLEHYKKRPVPIRYFAVGEYGNRGTERPHYHIIFFGISDMDIDVIRSVDAAWREPAKKGQRGQTPSFGIWTLDPLNSKRVAYVAGYVMKKLIKPKKVFHTIVSSMDVGNKRYVFRKRVVDRKRSDSDEQGRVAEFRTMSRMPGLGSDFIFDIVALWKSNAAFRKVLTATGDVPSTLHAFGRDLFLDRFMKQKLRDLLGIEYDPTVYYAEVRQAFYQWLSTHPTSGTFVDYLVHVDDQKYHQLEERIKRQLQKRNRL